MAAPQLAPSVATDEELIARVGAGDEAAFELLYQRYFKRVFHFVDKRLRNRADTEETVQEVFINVFSSMASYRGDAPFAAWVLGLTRRTIASRFKKKQHSTVPLGGDDELVRVDYSSPTVQREPTPLEHYECSERIEQLQEVASEKLTTEQCQLFELHHLMDQSINDLAQSLQKSEDSVKSSLYRTRKLLLAR